MRIMRYAAVAAAAGVCAWASRRASSGFARSGRWTRTNHRGEPISLLEGPAMTTGLVVGALVTPLPPHEKAAAVVAVAGAGGFGLVDDLGEDPAQRAKGLKGHLGALAHGQITTGGLKILGIGAASMIAAALVHASDGLPGPRRVAEIALDGALIAGSANLVNLLDLRPGRALKAAALVSLPMVGTASGSLSAALAGTEAALAPADLAEADMLGDCGANALGALLGVQLAVSAPVPVRLGAFATVLVLTLVSEKVSFSAVIDANPVLHWIDQWGRRHPIAADQGGNQ